MKLLSEVSFVGACVWASEVRMPRHFGASKKGATHNFAVCIVVGVGNVKLELCAQGARVCRQGASRTKIIRDEEG